MRFVSVVYPLLLAVQTATALEIPHVEVIPLPGHQVSLQILGEEKARWHFGSEYPRPFLFPITGPSGAVLTRMGHPGAPNHDHHRSVWFAHQKVNGHNFWSDTGNTQIRQKDWMAYRDGKKESIMANLTGWFAPDGSEQMEQELITALIPLSGDEYAIEFQTTMRPAGQANKVELGKTNFGFLAVRVAKSISEFFGGGTLTNSEGQTHEQNTFGKRARWMDYSGPVTVGKGNSRKVVDEGITFFDHPTNPRYPTFWHVRQDGWMGASFCRSEGYTITRDEPLVLRYLLHSHSGHYDSKQAATVAKQFANRNGFQIVNRPQSHHQFGVERIR